MAKPIKETPILTNKDAAAFFYNMKDAESKKISTQEITRIKANANKLKSIAKF